MRRSPSALRRRAANPPVCGRSPSARAPSPGRARRRSGAPSRSGACRRDGPPGRTRARARRAGGRGRSPSSRAPLAFPPGAGPVSSPLSSCMLLYKRRGTALPEVRRDGSLRTLYRAPAVRGSRMAGELIGDRIVVEDPAEGSALHNRGFFGRPRPGGGLELDLLEAIYLVEADRLAVRRKGRAVSARELFRAASAAIESFEIRYLVYRDLRQRGYVVEARSGPVDFQVYPRGGAPRKTPSRYWVRSLSERAVFDLAELLERAEEAAGVRKTLLLGLVDEESDVTYYSVREAHPRGHRPSERPKGRIVVHFLGDRAVVIDEGEAQALHAAGFFGKMIGRRLQLSLLETAYHAKYLVHVVPKGHRGAWPEISRAVRLAHGVKKQILFGEVGEDVRYVKLERVRP